MLHNKNQRSESKSERNYDVLKSKRLWFLLNKNINVNKNETEQKWIIPHTTLERQSWQFSSYKNRKLKVKLWWDRAHEKNSVHFLERSFFSKEIFSTFLFSFLIYTVYFIKFNYLNINHFKIFTFTCQKTLLHILFCLFLKFSKAFSLSLRKDQDYKGHVFKWQMLGHNGTCLRDTNITGNIIAQNM